LRSCVHSKRAVVGEAVRASAQQKRMARRTRREISLVAIVGVGELVSVAGCCCCCSCCCWFGERNGSAIYRWRGTRPRVSIRQQIAQRALAGLQ
jgi:hypothetical protein